MFSGPNPPRLEDMAIAVVQGGYRADSEARELLKTLQGKVITAVRSGYLDILHRIHDLLPTFSFSFTYPVQVRFEYLLSC